MKNGRFTKFFLEIAFLAVTIFLVAAFPWKSTMDELRSRLLSWAQRQTPIITQMLPQPSPTPSPPRTDEVAAAIQRIRTENDLHTFEENIILQKLARLLTLEAEDSGSLSQSENTGDILRTLSPTTPRSLESAIFFIPVGSSFDPYAELQNNSAVLESDYRHFGVATRSAQFEGEAGTMLAISFSTPFQRAVAPAPKTAAKPTFTGQDLWQAVQNYRKAHLLPEFQMSSELCTVASIRVNELLELGKLDNHEGFQPQSDAFFERHPQWTAINENLAAGYPSAVQTVEWGWDQSLGHQALIKSRDFPYACTAANSGFSVLITGK